MARKRRKRSKTGIVKDSQGRWRYADTGKFAPSPQAVAAQNRKKKDKKGNISESRPQIAYERQMIGGLKDIGLSGGSSRRKLERSKKRSESAKRGWETRRIREAAERAAAERRSESARKGWETRRQKEKIKVQKKFEAAEKGKRTKAANQAAKEIAGKAKGSSLGTTRPGTNKYQNILKRFAEKVAAFGQRTMEEEAPVMDGNLQSSITSTVEKTSYGYSVSVYPNIYYAEWVNYGTDPYGTVNADYMEFIWKQRGNIYVKTTEVSGQMANPFIDRTEAATQAYVASQEADLADQIELAFRTGT